MIIDSLYTLTVVGVETLVKWDQQSQFAYKDAPEQFKNLIVTTKLYRALRDYAGGPHPGDPI
jgi:hypothetical protein